MSVSDRQFRGKSLTYRRRLPFDQTSDVSGVKLFWQAASHLLAFEVDSDRHEVPPRPRGIHCERPRSKDDSQTK